MYFYNIGYGSPEDSEYYTLIHDDRFDDTDLETMVFEAAEAVIREKQKETHHHLHGYNDISPYVADWLVANKGFRFIEYEAQWTCFGWPSMFVKDDWGDSWDDQPLARLVSHLNSKGFTWKDDDHIRRGIEEYGKKPPPEVDT